MLLKIHHRKREVAMKLMKSDVATLQLHKPRDSLDSICGNHEQHILHKNFTSKFLSLFLNEIYIVPKIYLIKVVL